MASASLTLVLARCSHPVVRARTGTPAVHGAAYPCLHCTHGRAVGLTSPGLCRTVRQVLYIAYCFFCLIVLSAYTANLTSFLSITNLKTAVGSLQVRMEQGWLCLFVPPGCLSSHYRSLPFPSLSAWVILMRVCSLCITGCRGSWASRTDWEAPGLSTRGNRGSPFYVPGAG